jgi:hypothetical protein
MFKVYTKEIDTVPVCADCGCYIIGKVLKNYEDNRFYCVECVEPWILEEDWLKIIQ